MNDLINMPAASSADTRISISQRPGIGHFIQHEDVASGRLKLCTQTLKGLRRQRCLSQEEVASECMERRIRLSIASIKRAETGNAVLYRTAREFARFYQVPVERLFP